MAASKVPNAWDEEDWDTPTDKPPAPASRRPNPTAPSFNPPTAPRLFRPEFDHAPPPILYAPCAGGVPKTLYKPELKILKRSSPEAPGGGGGTVPAAAPPSDETEKERRERERKDRERRYKEARSRIMGDTTTTVSTSTPQPSSSPPTPAPKGAGKKAKNTNGKRSPDANTPKSSHRTSPTNRSPTNRSPTNRSPAPSRKPSPPRGGAITSFSLNGGEFAAAPVPGRFYSREVDGKLLESELLGAGGVSAGETFSAETAPEGLDWDSFERGGGGWNRQQQGWGGAQGYYMAGVDYGYATAAAGVGYSGGAYEYQSAGMNGYDYSAQTPPRQQNPGIYGGAAAADFPTTTTSRFNVYNQPERQTWSEKAAKQPGGAQVGVVQAVRAPRGPDADGGPGFKGRGGRGGAGGIVGGMRGMRVREGGL